MTESNSLIKIAGCDNPERIGDVIFVHGLGGDPIRTWHPNEKQDPKICWLGWLGEDLPDVGIWSLGYEVEPFKWKGDAVIILVPLIWFIRPVLGETAIAKLINGGVSLWDSLEGWALTGKWSMSALSSPPEQFVRDYFSDINNSQYSAAWSRLSPEFQRDKTLMSTGYISYTDWWKQIERVDINQVTLVSKDNASAIVNIRLQYFMKETKKLLPSESIRIFLRWDSLNGRWLIDKLTRI